MIHEGWIGCCPCLHQVYKYYLACRDVLKCYSTANKSPQCSSARIVTTLLKVVIIHQFPIVGCFVQAQLEARYQRAGQERVQGFNLQNMSNSVIINQGRFKRCVGKFKGTSQLFSKRLGLFRKSKHPTSLQKSTVVISKTSLEAQCILTVREKLQGLSLE